MACRWRSFAEDMPEQGIEPALPRIERAHGTAPDQVLLAGIAGVGLQRFDDVATVPIVTVDVDRPEHVVGRADCAAPANAFQDAPVHAGDDALRTGAHRSET